MEQNKLFASPCLLIYGKLWLRILPPPARSTTATGTEENVKLRSHFSVLSCVNDLHNSLPPSSTKIGRHYDRLPQSQYPRIDWPNTQAIVKYNHVVAVYAGALA